MGKTWQSDQLGWRHLSHLARGTGSGHLVPWSRETAAKTETLFRIQQTSLLLSKPRRYFTANRLIGNGFTTVFVLLMYHLIEFNRFQKITQELVLVGQNVKILLVSFWFLNT